MSKIYCSNSDIKNQYKYLIKKFKGLPSIIRYITKDNGDITVKVISGDDNNINIFIEKDDKDYLIWIDILKNKIYLNTPEEKYNLVFKNISSKNATPIGYYCFIDGKAINESFLFELNHMPNVRHFEVFIGNDKYVIVINSDKLFDESRLFNNIFHNIIRNIIDLYHVIAYSINSKDMTISIGDSCNSTIVIKNGEMIKYDVYLDDKDYVKKLGERDGKEKR